MSASNLRKFWSCQNPWALRHSGKVVGVCACRAIRAFDGAKRPRPVIPTVLTHCTKVHGARKTLRACPEVDFCCACVLPSEHPTSTPRTPTRNPLSVLEECFSRTNECKESSHLVPGKVYVLIVQFARMFGMSGRMLTHQHPCLCQM